MKKAIIIDLDGTLANIEHRRPLVEGEKKDWKKFFDEMGNDTVNEWCKAIISRFYDPQDFHILLVTGRPADYSSVTTFWLNGNFISYHTLLMRKAGDYRSDDIVKKEIYEKEIKGKYDVLFVVDDRKQVVDMWRNEGLTVLQCAEGNF